MLGRDRSCLWALLALYGVLFWVNCAWAYVGPGSGVEFIGYFLSLAAWVGAAFLSILLWPLYTLLRKIRGKGSRSEISPPTVAGADQPTPAGEGAQAARPDEGAVGDI